MTVCGGSWAVRRMMAVIKRADNRPTYMPTQQMSGWN